jgi:tRNA nucleotidyltransferase (CCA-adding enzyme)
MKLEFSTRQEVFEAVLRLCEAVAEAGGRALLVGGCVRDAVLGSEIEDFDLEVFGLAPQRLRSVVEGEYEVDLVGEAFGVLKLRRWPIDVSLPRRESKSGLGHRGFEIFADPDLGVEEAAARRDFTINAILYDPLAPELLDPHQGVQDLKNGILRATSGKFSEDPLRVLRGMQLVARFGLQPDPGTLGLCRRIEPEGLARERIFEEWKKLILRGARPSAGLGFLRDCGWVRHFPELEALIACPQDPEWHPEGDVWTHTLHVMDAFADERVGDPWEDLVVGLACLCHDFGKPATTRCVDGRVRSLGHEAAGEAPTRSFLAGLTNQEKLVDEVLPLVAHHLKPLELYRVGAGSSAVRRLARKVGRIDRLVRTARADSRGRPPLVFDGFPAGDWLLDRAERLKLAAEAPQPLVMGRHLLARGLAPGPQLGRLLERCFEAQLDGRFETLERGLAFLDALLSAQREEDEP